ncbi:MAG: hypothetical protein JNL10_20210 [Verrucomicrobiales bacterium]|nr:hypothetical protein [Verrucomicrobiales bacterium]
MTWFRNAVAGFLAMGACAGPALGPLRGATEPGEVPVEFVPLPALRIAGEPAWAHTQGLEIVGDRYLVTARREDGAQRRALLLQWSAGDSNWSSWDLTPPGAPTLDHPGGMQSDERRLWIPVSESRRKGKSVVRAYSLQGWTPERIPKPEIEFPVDDHIGAVAVLAGRSLLVGASWDTETVYLWDFSGAEKEVLRGAALSRLGLGPGTRETPGLRVQDWKGTAGGLVASGLVPTGGASSSSVSRVLFLGDSLSSPPILLSLPSVAGVELGREAMAVHDGRLWFLPGDLGETNRLIRIPMPKVP